MLDLQTLKQSKTPYEDACKAVGEEPKMLEQFIALYGEKNAQYWYSMHRIVTVIAAVKGDRVLDYNNSDQEKWSPWFWLNDKPGDAAGSGFRFDVTIFGLTYTDVGARLSSAEEGDSAAIAEVMHEDYKVIMKH